jgi:hypothetical protein
MYMPIYNMYNMHKININVVAGEAKHINENSSYEAEEY